MAGLAAAWSLPDYTGARFVFTDHRSARYDDTVKHESEAMAQRAKATGLKDGHEIPPQALDLLALEAK